MINLSSLHILLTRPAHQAQQSAIDFVDCGARVTCHPFLVITPLRDTADQQMAKDPLLKLDHYQKMIFVIQNAVHYGVQWIDQFWPQLPAGLAFFAVGKTTADQLQQSLSYLDSGVQSPGYAMNSEGLLALSALNDVKGQKILIARGCGGRSHLAQTLERRGACVDYCELYQRQAPREIDIEKLEQFRQTSEKPVVLVLSGETLDNLRKLLLDWNLEYWQWLQTQVLVVPGQRLADLARKQNFQAIVVAKSAMRAHIIGAINDWRKR